MKTENSVAKKTKAVKPERLSTRLPDPPLQEEDLPRSSTLSQLKKTLENFYQPQGPSIIDCEDAAAWAYRQACALLTYTDLADQGMYAEGSFPAEPIAGYVMESIRLQLDIVRLAGKALFRQCDVNARAEREASKAA